MYPIFIFKSIYARPPFPSLDAWSLAYTIRESVPLSQHHNFGIYDKEIRERRAREQRGREHIISKNPQKKAQAIYYYLDLLYVLKGFLDWSITHLTFYHPKLTYQCMLGIHHTINPIYININILPTIIINPYTMQITFHIKVFFKS